MNNFIRTNTYKDIIQNRRHCYFISPHIDDAIFSAGGLIYELRNKGVEISILNIFTKPSSPPYTASIKKFLRLCRYKNAFELYKDRIKEENYLIKYLGIKIINLGFIDALWRKKDKGVLMKQLSKIIPETLYVYPIFSLAIRRGIVSKYDQGLFLQIENKLKKIITPDAVIFLPIAQGGHMDHVITRDVGLKLANTKILWSDYPYSKKHGVNTNFLNKNLLRMYNMEINANAKKHLASIYKSQIGAIFGKNGVTVEQHERYYLK